MEVNKNNCPVCGTVFMAQRSTRVYCSDKCRGQAFLLRKAEELFGADPAFQTDNATRDELTSNGKKVIIVEAELLLSQIQELLRKTVREELRLTINANGNNRLTSNDNKTGGEELKSEISLYNEEIIVQPEKQDPELTVNVKTELTPNANAIIGSNDKETSEKEILSFETVGNTNVLKEETEQGNEKGLPLNDSEASNRLTLRNSKDDKVPVEWAAMNVVRSVSGEENEKTITSNAKSKKEVFEYHPSAFINEMVEIVDYRDYASKFQYPHHDFNQEAAKVIKNVNLFVRCLLESTIKLSRHKSIPLGELGKLTQGYWYVIHSNKFKQIKNIYPATETITKIATTILNQHEHLEDNTTIRFVLSRELKMEIISMLHEISDSVPFYKFSELFTNEVLKPNRNENKRIERPDRGY